MIRQAVTHPVPSSPTPVLATETAGEFAAAQRAAEVAVLEQIAEAFYAVDSNWRIVAINAAAEPHFALPRDAILGRGLWEVLPASAGTWFESWLTTIMATGRADQLETPCLHRPDRLVEIRAFPLDLGPAGRGLGVLLTDRTWIREAERASAEQQSVLDGLLAALEDGIIARDRSGRDLLAGTAQQQRHAVSDSDRTLDRQAMESGQIIRSETVVTTADGESRILETLRRPLRDRQGHISGVVGLNRDVTLLRRCSAQHEILAREVDHRVRNALMVVQTLVRLVDADTVPVYKGAIEGRIAALAACYRVLSAHGWGPVPLAELAASILPGSGDGDPGEPSRLALTGAPTVLLQPEGAQALGLALHELASNALRHGALSTDAGDVALDWTLHADGRGTLRWTEHGGPPLSRAPLRRGFGLLLLETTMHDQLGGTLQPHWARSGLDLTVELPAGVLLPGPVPAPIC